MPIDSKSRDHSVYYIYYYCTGRGKCAGAVNGRAESVVSRSD